MLFFSISYGGKNRLRTVASPGAWDAWLSWINARRQYMFLVIIIISIFIITRIADLSKRIVSRGNTIALCVQEHADAR